jgi:glycosyltransferase involved in cell wall biosynthesis
VIIFDISDLVYYIGHHPNLTGIQRVQSSIVLAMIDGRMIPKSDVVFLSFDANARRWVSIPVTLLTSFLQNLFLPENQRRIPYSAEEAKHGLLPGSTPFDGLGVLNTGAPSVFCLLGAAWVQRDYFHRVLSFKRRFGTKFVMTVHDLIPIFARETCDQGTATVFEEFLRRALRHVDHYLTVSENTAKDLRKYTASKRLPAPQITVTRLGASFDEFLPPVSGQRSEMDVPGRFVLFVSTIEGRKNHKFMFNLWRQMIEDGEDVPHLICVGRVGWRVQDFLTDVVESDHLDGRIIILQEISDADLKLLYDRCIFTVFPSAYEGWGLPVGESLAAGKICVCSDRASLPEVAGKYGTYIDIDDPEQSYTTVRTLVSDDGLRQRREQEIRNGYKPISWSTVAQSVISGCKKAIERDWTEPYPYPHVPYSLEVSFASVGQNDPGAFGDSLLSRTQDSRRGHFLRAPLQEACFLLGEDMRASGVWAEPEAWGTWMCRTSADLCAGLEPNESLEYYVFLRLRTSGPLSEAPVRVTSAGKMLWSGKVGDRSRNAAMRVRRRQTDQWWNLHLRIDAEVDDETLAMVAAIDGRVPTIGLERLVIVPENDLKARLDILTNILLEGGC